MTANSSALEIPVHFTSLWQLIASMKRALYWLKRSISKASEKSIFLQKVSICCLIAKACQKLLGKFVWTSHWAVFFVTFEETLKDISVNGKEVFGISLFLNLSRN